MIDDLTRVYLPGHRTAHLTSFSPNETDAPALCNVTSGADDDGLWRGTGDQDERDHAARLPLCQRCQAKAEQMSQLRQAREAAA